MDRTKTFYTVIRFILKITVFLVLPYKITGRENIPDGAAIICANHSSNVDPLLVAFAVPGKYHVCFLAKKELFKGRIAAWFFRSLGVISVDRGKADLDSMKLAFKCLKSGKKLGIFPEGTRVARDDDVEPKLGAVRIAEKTGAPIVPVYIPRTKKLFHRVRINVGEPLTIEKRRRAKNEYAELANDLMSRINALAG